MKKWIRLISFTLVLSALFVSVTKAETVEFPDEELATETVLPKFDRPTAVKNRNVVTAQRAELGVFAGWNFSEPFFSNQKVGLLGSYHFDEISALNLSAAFYMSGVSTYADQLKDKYNLDFTKAPGPKSVLLAHYQFTAFYGKMSLTKQAVMNLSVYGLFGGGLVSYSGYSSPALSVGIGEKFYFTPNFAIRVDMGFLGYQGLNPLTKDSSGSTRIGPNGSSSSADAGSMDKQTYFDTQLNLGLVYLL